jgi:hypothetical protein
LILPIKCPRLQSGCCTIDNKIEPNIYNDRCKRQEEYVYCEYYSTWGPKESSSVMKIIQTNRKR